MGLLWSVGLAIPFFRLSRRFTCGDYLRLPRFL